MTDPSANGTSPTDPAEPAAWLRALPQRTVLLDKDQLAWQVGLGPLGMAVMMRADSASTYMCSSDRDMEEVAQHGPFRVLWTGSGAVLP